MTFSLVFIKNFGYYFFTIFNKVPFRYFDLIETGYFLSFYTKQSYANGRLFRILMKIGKIEENTKHVFLLTKIVIYGYSYY